MTSNRARRLGAELQVIVPRMNAPLRFYWAYNPLVYRGAPQPPPVFDRHSFPNDATDLNAIHTVGAPTPFQERHFTFRFSIGRTFKHRRRGLNPPP